VLFVDLVSGVKCALLIQSSFLSYLQMGHVSMVSEEAQQSASVHITTQTAKSLEH